MILHSLKVVVLLIILASTAYAAPTSYTANLTVGDIKEFYGLTPTQPINIAVIRAKFIALGIDVRDSDLSTARWMDSTSSAFYRDAATREHLRTGGLLTRSSIYAKDYLRYLNIVFGANDGTTQATVRHLTAHLMLLQNYIFNLRAYIPCRQSSVKASKSTAGRCDKQWLNRASLHREAWANELLFDGIAAWLGYTHDPMKDIFLTRSDMHRIFGFGPARSPHATMALYVASLVIPAEGTKGTTFYRPEGTPFNSAMAYAVANQYAGPPGEEGEYGTAAFVNGMVRCYTGACRRSLPGPLPRDHYKKDRFLANRLIPVLGGPPSNGSPMLFADCTQAEDFVLALVGHAGYSLSGGKLTPLPYTPPSSACGHRVTAAQAREALIALSNSLTNVPNAPFRDILPRADLAALALNTCSGTGCENDENKLSQNIEMDYTEAILYDFETRFPPPPPPPAVPGT